MLLGAFRLYHRIPGKVSQNAQEKAYRGVHQLESIPCFSSHFLHDQNDAEQQLHTVLSDEPILEQVNVELARD